MSTRNGNNILVAVYCICRKCEEDLYGKKLLESKACFVKLIFLAILSSRRVDVNLSQKGLTGKIEFVVVVVVEKRRPSKAKCTLSCLFIRTVLTFFHSFPYSLILFKEITSSIYL